MPVRERSPDLFGKRIDDASELVLPSGSFLAVLHETRMRHLPANVYHTLVVDADGDDLCQRSPFEDFRGWYSGLMVVPPDADFESDQKSPRAPRGGR